MTNGDQNTREILTVKQAAEWLQVTTETVLAMIHRGLPAIKVGKGYRISKPALEAYMAGEKSKVEELQEQVDVAKLEIDLAVVLALRDKPEQLRLKEEELNKWAALLESMVEHYDPDEEPDEEPKKLGSISEILKGNLGMGVEERAMHKRHKDKA